nr:hypothetical protein [Bifidobacterium simiiventris]
MVPVASFTDVVRSAAAFTVIAPVRGWFRPTVELGAYVTADAVLGWVGGTRIASPVDGVVEAVADANDVAAHYPVFSIRYTGMSSTVDASALLKTVGIDTVLRGRFQIRDGQGPTDCLAVVETSVAAFSADDTADGATNGIAAVIPDDDDARNVVAIGAGTIAGGDDSSDATQSGDDGAAGSSLVPQSSSSTMQCLFPKDVSARTGQSVTTVLRAPQTERSLIVPITAVAGRSGSGEVLKKTDDGFEKVKVTLGASDGTSIIIMSGLREGDEVSAAAPNLVPQSVGS